MDIETFLKCSRKTRNLVLLCLLFWAPFPVHAYIGPGLGVGTIAVILGVIGSIFLALFAVCWYPLKRLFKKRGVKKEKKSTDPMRDNPDSEE